MQSLKKWIPIVHWLPKYQRNDLRGDIAAGLTVAVMLVPQGMAYAMLAGLPLIVGLYASIVPLLIYAMFGSSPQLAVGPVAIVSLMVATGVSRLAQPGTGEYLLLATLLALLVGIVQLGMGMTRLGFLVNFLAHPVISGFTSAAALIIGLSQLKHLLGIAIPRGGIHTILWYTLQHISDVHVTTLIIGVSSIAMLMILKKWQKLLPGALVVVAVGTTLVWLLGLADAGVKIVGVVPGGLPSPQLPAVDGDAVLSLLPIALAISMVGFTQSIAVAKSFAARNQYEIEANQELTGLGLANIAAGFFGAYPVTGGFSRTAVNAQTGARTGLASMITAGTIALTVLFLTDLFYYLPYAVLAAIIMVAVLGLIDVKEVVFLYRVKKSDLSLLILAFVSTLTLGIENGILVSVFASLVLVIKQTTAPHSAELGRLPGSTIFRNIERYPEAETTDGLAILRIDAPLYFANIEFLRDRLQKLEHKTTSPLHAIVFDASSVSSIDSSAVTALSEIVKNYQRRDIQFYMANVRGPVRDVMKRSSFYDLLGADHFFYCIEDAIKHFHGQIESIENEAPRGIVIAQ